MAGQSKFQLLVRLGYLARATLYSLLGLIALTDLGRVSGGQDSVFDTVGEMPGGTALLWIMAAGLAGFGLFRLSSALFDIEHEGTDKHGIMRRLGHGGSAIGHFVLAQACYRFANTRESGGNTAQEAAAGVLSLDIGPLLLGLAGLTFIAAAAFQARRGWTGDFMHRISHAAPSATRWLGGAGYIARSVVFLVIGWSLLRSGWFSDDLEVNSLGGAIASLSDNGPLFTIVAFGLLLFGLFSLVLSRYRIVPEMNMERHIPTFRA